MHFHLAGRRTFAYPVVQFKRLDRRHCTELDTLGKSFLRDLRRRGVGAHGMAQGLPADHPATTGKRAPMNPLTLHPVIDGRSADDRKLDRLVDGEKYRVFSATLAIEKQHTAPLADSRASGRGRQSFPPITTRQHCRHGGAIPGCASRVRGGCARPPAPHRLPRPVPAG